eukprot:2661688-Prymnesium_polylepis.2
MRSSSNRFIVTGRPDRYRTHTRQDIAPNAMVAADVRACACAVLCAVLGVLTWDAGREQSATRKHCCSGIFPLMRSVYMGARFGTFFACPP